MKRVIIEAPYIDQSPRWPTGCESVSAVMLLRYLGYDITVDEFINNDLEMQDFREEMEMSSDRIRGNISAAARMIRTRLDVMRR